MPVPAKSCDRCRRWHSTCEPSLVIENGVEKKSTCKRCKQRGVPCVYPENPTKKWKKQTGRRIEQAKQLYGESQTPYGGQDDLLDSHTEVQVEQEAPSRRRFNGPRETNASQGNTVATYPGKQNSSPTSKENKMRQSKREELLVIDLIQSAIHGGRIGYFIDKRINARVNYAGQLITDFETHGFRISENALGKYGEAILALLCSIGSAISSHSQVVGGNTSHLPELPSEWFRDERLIAQDADSWNYSKSTGFSLVGDLRAYGIARKSARRKLWRWCWKAFEDSGLLEEDDHGAEELHLLEQVLQYAYEAEALTQEELTHLRKITLRKFRTLPLSSWPSRGARQAIFELKLAEESQRCVLHRQLPIISDQDLMEMMADPEISPQAYLTFDRTLLPPVHDLDSHHQIVWASNISIERMLAIVGHTIPILPDSEAEGVLTRMYSIFQQQKEWRRSTYEALTNPERETRINMTVFGLEDTLLTKLDVWSKVLVHGMLLRLILERAASNSSIGPRLSHLRRLCANDLDHWLGELASDTGVDKRYVPFGWYCQALPVLESLPGGVAYLREYLLRSSDAQQRFERTRQIARIWNWAKQLSYKGQIALTQLFTLEKGFNMTFDEFVSLHGLCKKDIELRVIKYSET